MGNRHASSTTFGTSSSSRDDLMSSMLSKTPPSSALISAQQKGLSATLLLPVKSKSILTASSVNDKKLVNHTDSSQLNHRLSVNNSNSNQPSKDSSAKTDSTLATTAATSTVNTLTRATQRPTQLNIAATRSTTQSTTNSKFVSAAVTDSKCGPQHVHPVPPQVCACHQSAPNSSAWPYATPPPSLSDTSASSSSATSANVITFPYNANCSSSSSSTMSSSSSSTLATCHQHCHYCHCHSNELAPACCNHDCNSRKREQTKEQLGPTTSTNTNNTSSTLITPSQSRPNLNINSSDTISTTLPKNNNKKPVKRKRSLLLSACMPLTATTPNSPLTPPAENTIVAMPTSSNGNSSQSNAHYCCKNHNSTESACNNNNYHCHSTATAVNSCHINCHCHHKQQQPRTNFSRSCQHYCSEHNYRTTSTSGNKKIAARRNNNNSLRRGYDSDGESKECHATQTKQFLPPADSWNSGAEWRLPYGWEVAIDQTGRPYFINHEAKYTTYEDPRTALLLSPPPQPRTITLVRDPTIGFGFVASAEKPVIVRFVTEGGPSHGKLLPGDQVLQVNGEDVEQSPREHVINLVRSSSSNVVLRVCQPPTDPNARKSALLDNAIKKKPSQKNRRVTFADHGAATTAATGPAPTISQTSSQPPPKTAAPPAAQNQQFVPNVLKVFLENGQTKSFKYDAKTTVGDVMASLKEKLSIRNIEHFTLAIENVRSQRRNLLHFLQTDETITSIAGRPTAQYLRCLFRLMFSPNDVNTLLQRDSVAFEYFYMQCCNDVVEERYANELRVDIALRLAALHMQQHAIANNLSGSATNVNKNVTVKLVEKECGLERFVPASILTTFNRKELRKILTTFIKLNAQYLAAPGQKRVGEMQAKLSYIKLLSELPSFGGKCFNLLIYPPNTTFNNGNSTESSPSSSSRLAEQQAIEALMLMSPKYGISQITATPNGNPIQLCHLHDVVELTVRPNRNAGPSANAAQSDIDATLIDMRVAIDNVNSTILTVGTESRDDLNDILCLLEGYAKCAHHQLPIHKLPTAESMQSLTATVASLDTAQNDDTEPKKQSDENNNIEYDEDEEEEDDDDEQANNREPAPSYYGQHAVLKMPWNFVHGRHVMSITLIDPDAAPGETDQQNNTMKKVPSNQHDSTAQRSSHEDDLTSQTKNGVYRSGISSNSTEEQHYTSTTSAAMTASDESSSEQQTTPKAERRTSLPTAHQNGGIPQKLNSSSDTTTSASQASSSPPSASSYDNLLAAVCSDDSEQQARRLLKQQQLYTTAQQARLIQKVVQQNQFSANSSKNNVTEIAVNHQNGIARAIDNVDTLPHSYTARDCTKFIDESATSSEVDTPVVDAPHVISYLLTSNNNTTVMSSDSTAPLNYFNLNGRCATQQTTSGETAKLFYQALSKVPPLQGDQSLSRTNNFKDALRSNQSSSNYANIDVDSDDDEDEENSSSSATPTSIAGRSPAHSGGAAAVAKQQSAVHVKSPTLNDAQNSVHRSCSSFGLQSPLSPSNEAFKAQFDNIGEASPQANNATGLLKTSDAEISPVSSEAPQPDSSTQQEIIDLTLIPLPEPSIRKLSAGSHQRKYSPPTIVIPPTPFRDDISNMEQIFPTRSPPRDRGSRMSQQQQNRLARNAALLDETLQELDLFINQVTIPPPPPPSTTSNVSQLSPSPVPTQHLRSSSQDDSMRTRSNGFANKPPSMSSKLPNDSPKHHNITALGGHYNSPSGKPPPVGGVSPVLGMRSKSATRVGSGAFSEAPHVGRLVNGSINRPSISGVERPMALSVKPTADSGEHQTDVDANQQLHPRSAGMRPRPPPRDRVRRKVLHTMLQKSLEDDGDSNQQQTTANPAFMSESVSGEPNSANNNFAIPGSPCDLAVYMDLLAERTTSKLDKLMAEMEWTAVSYCSSRPPDYNPAQMRVARDQLVCEARRFVSTSKSFVKSASMAFTHQYYNRPVSAGSNSMSEEHALVYVESLKRCTDLITMMYYSAQLVARAAQNGEQAAGLMRGIMQVASTFRATVQASMGKSGDEQRDTIISSADGATTVPVLSSSSSSLKELMCEATKLAASLTALMRTIRSTDMKDEKSIA